MPGELLLRKYKSATRGYPTTGPSNTPAGSTGPAYDQYNNAINQDTALYNSLMSGYQGLYNKVDTSPSSNVNFTSLPEYKRSGALSNAMSQLQGWTSSGGFNPSEIYDMRERGISPIRAVYANANRDIDRTKSLQGGYSPSYNALKAKMAREQSKKTAQATTDFNARIAELVRSGKQGALSQLANLAAGESGAENEYNLRRTSMMNDNLLKNSELAQGKDDDLLRILEGMRGLYGTTPALTSSFANQAMAQSNLRNNIRQQNKNRKLNMFNTIIGGR